MRPVSKWVHTDNTIVPPILETYNPYQSAKEDLIRNIDSYCSYCESPVKDDAIHVEHIQPKGLAKYKHLEYKWSNFLLACARCNGADNKSDKDVIYGQIHLPNTNNTLLSIDYQEGGLAKANPLLQNIEYDNAVRLINLVGLDKRPGHADYKEKDKRWDKRREVWELAKRNYVKYQDGKIDEEVIIDLAKGYGFWSIWFKIFQNHLSVKSALIHSFNGTEKICFDVNSNPVFRNPQNPHDRI